VVDPVRPDVRRDGDEPALLARSLPEVPVIVGPDRAEASALAVRSGARVALLDDGFQHRKLARELDVVLWDRRAERSEGRLLPRGALREPLSGLSRAGAIVLVDRGDGGPEAPSGAPDEGRTFRARLRPFARQPLDVGTPVHALSGVADAVSFEGSLARLGLRISGATRYPDHHVFTTREVIEAAGRARGEGAHHLAVTAKDHVRWPSESEGTLPVPAVFDLSVELDPEERFLALVSSVLGGSECE
jgi:tetraacyldisaccharide 4'-kinase